VWEGVKTDDLATTASGCSDKGPRSHTRGQAVDGTRTGPAGACGLMQGPGRRADEIAQPNGNTNGQNLARYLEFRHSKGSTASESGVKAGLISRNVLQHFRIPNIYLHFQGQADDDEIHS